MADNANVLSSFSTTDVVVVVDTTGVVAPPPSVLPREGEPGGDAATGAGATSVEDTPCRHKDKCYNSECKYKHPEGYVPGPAPCKHGDKCRILGCPRKHPAGYVALMKLPTGMLVPVIGITLEGFPILGGSVVPKAASKPAMLTWSTVARGGCGGAPDSDAESASAAAAVRTCRHTDAGRDCFNRECKFKHPDGYTPGPKTKCRKGGKCSAEHCQFAHPCDPEWKHL